MNAEGKDLIKSVNLWLKEQSGSDVKRPVGKKNPETTQVTFNCSDALLLAPQGLFYSELMQCLSDARAPHQEPLDSVDPVFRVDPEDQLADVM
jgi:hypothetical protein